MQFRFQQQLTAIILLFFCITTLSAQVRTGAECTEAYLPLLKGKSVALVVNHTSVVGSTHLVDTLQKSGVKIVKIFAPEHGFRGEAAAGEHVNSTTDQRTGLPIVSLYGSNRKPTAEQLADVDIVLFDIQDVGARFYTYISTMHYAMEAAAENGKQMIVLDRPNPLGGLKIEGNLTEDPFISFVSQFKIPYLYGQTCGELALMLNEEKMLAKKCKLTVVKMKGWKRKMTWEDTKLEWVVASPHIPHKHSSYFYPVTGILGELGYISIGVGYTLPFQIIGAPWINADSLTNALNNLQLPGITFRPIHFKPFYSTFKDEHCHGSEIHIMDYKKANLAEIQFYIMQELNKLYPAKAVFANANKDRFNMFDKVSGSDQIRLKFAKDHNFDDIKAYWNKDVESYRNLSKKYYLYR